MKVRSRVIAAISVGMVHKDPRWIRARVLACNDTRELHHSNFNSILAVHVAKVDCSREKPFVTSIDHTVCDMIFGYSLDLVMRDSVLS